MHIIVAAPRRSMKLLLRCLWLLSLCSAQITSQDTTLSSPHYNADVDQGVHGTYPVRKFRTSETRAPVVNFLNWTSECEDGLYTFVTPRGWSVRYPGPMIWDSNGSTIWSQHFGNDFGGQAYDLKVQSYKGHDYLTFWLGDDRIRGHGHGHYHMLDASYETVRKISAVNGLYADLHEMVITSEGTALLIAYHILPFDVRPAGRKFDDLWNQAIWECVIQEVDLESNELLFEWKASEHMNLATTYEAFNVVASGTQQDPFDPYHLNSVQKDALGNYLVSARNTHCIYYIDGTTKDIIWRLGGKNNQYMDLSEGHALNFAWQHDARFVAPSAFPEIYTPPQHRDGVTITLMTVFDNAAVDWDYSYGPSSSRGLLLELTYPTPGMTKPPTDYLATPPSVLGLDKAREPLSQKDADKLVAINGTNPLYTVRLIQEFKNPQSIRSGTQGSVQLIPHEGKDPSIFVGYGLNAVMTEFHSDGSVICDVHYASRTSWEKGDVQSYRAYKFPWVGKPTAPPKMDRRSNTVYVSWNGATETREWLLQSSDRAKGGEWRNVSRVAKTEFETSISIPDQHRQDRYLRVHALDANGQACEYGMTSVLDRGKFRAMLQWERPRMGGSKVLILVMAIFASLVVLYQVLLRFLRWRVGRGQLSFWKWRRGVA